MRRVKLFLILPLSAVILLSHCPAIAEAALVVKVLQEASRNGHTYRLIGEGEESSSEIRRISWLDAEAYAASVGGHLATVDDIGEDQWIRDTFDAKVRAFDSVGITINRSIWLGLNDKDQEGTFVWSSGSTSSYRNWIDGEPAGSKTGSSPDEDFTGLLISSDANHGKWHDIISVSGYNAGDVTFGLVEINAVPEPTSIAFAAISAAAGWTCHRRRRRKTSESLGKKASQ